MVERINQRQFVMVMNAQHPNGGMRNLETTEVSREVDAHGNPLAGKLDSKEQRAVR
jgi:hypothetical protein